MVLTQFQTFFPPDATVAANTPFGVGRAAHGRPARVVVENVGATLVFLAGATADISGPDGPSSSTYRLLPGQSQVFVLSPEQTIFAMGSGAGAIISVTVSDAIPLSWEHDAQGQFGPPDSAKPKSVNPAYG